MWIANHIDSHKLYFNRVVGDLSKRGIQSKKNVKLFNYHNPYRIDSENTLNNREAEIQKSYSYNPVQQCTKPRSAETKHQ